LNLDHAVNGVATLEHFSGSMLLDEAGVLIQNNVAPNVLSLSVLNCSKKTFRRISFGIFLSFEAGLRYARSF